MIFRSLLHRASHVSTFLTWASLILEEHAPLAQSIHSIAQAFLHLTLRTLVFTMNAEFRPDANFEPWGPFIGPNFVNQRITYTDVIISSIIWVVTLGFMGLAVWNIVSQMKSARSPLRSIYIWFTWIELMASFVMGITAFLHLMKLIRPSTLRTSQP
jgi:hypothetical protein